MIGNPEYGKYVPKGINPHILSREFLLSVSHHVIIFLADMLCQSEIAVFYLFVTPHQKKFLKFEKIV